MAYSPDDIKEYLKQKQPEHNEAYAAEAELRSEIVTPEDISFRTLQQYFVLLTKDLEQLFRQTDNGSKKKAYNEVRKLINIHQKKWNYQHSKTKQNAKEASKAKDL